jgi:biopolymer transport protein ExbB/TolQ
MAIWLMKVVNALKVCGVWLKGNWLLLVLGAALVYAIFLAKNKSKVVDQLLKEFQNQQVQNRQQLDELRKIQREQITKQQEINAKYNEVLDRIQRNYQEQLRTLDVQKERDLRHIISVNKDDPAAMARDINALFGIPIYPN